MKIRNINVNIIIHDGEQVCQLQMRAGDAVSEEDPGVEVRSGRGVELRPVLPADHGVFCARRHMVGQQLDLLERGRVRQAQGGLFKIFIRIVDARDNRDADAKGLAAFFSRSRFSRIGSFGTPV